VVSLLLATTLSGEGAERFATAAYLSAIFAAVALALSRFFPAATVEDRTATEPPTPLFPKFLGRSVAIVLLLGIVAAFASAPGAEALVLGTSLVLIVIAALERSGTIASFNRALRGGGFLRAAARYGVVAAVAALVVAALPGNDNADAFASVAFRIAVLVTIALAMSLLAPTKAGVLARLACARTVEKLDLLTRALVFERAATFAGIAAVVALLPASVIPQPYDEPFAILAYIAAIAAAVAVAMECRRLRS